MEQLAQQELWVQLLVLVPLAAVLLISAYTDFRQRKVFNKVTYPMIIFGLVAHSVAFGLGGFGDGLMSVAIALVIGLLLAPLGWIGGGDIKLLMAVGATLGWRGLLHVSFYSVWVGAIGGLTNAAIKGYLWTMLKRVGRYIRGWFRYLIYKTPNVREELTEDERSKIPFAIAVLGGGILALTDVYYKWPGFWDWYIGVLAGK